MKKIFFGAIALISLVVNARAADLSVESPPSYAPYDWTGFYLGIHGGYGWGHDPFCTNEVIAGLTFNGIESRGAVYGMHAGYNWQYRSLVFGFETDLSATQIRGASPTQRFSDAFNMASASLEDRFNYLGSLRARAGYALMHTFLLYATGGAAWAHTTHTTNTSFTTNAPLPPFPSSSTVTEVFSAVSDRFGIALGAGAEVRFSVFAFPLIGRLEYLHYDFGTQTSDLRNITICNGPTCGTGALFNNSGRLTVDVLRAGVSIQFK
jgi:opacity protein-like surface antigen